jgi:hypothetical protein
MGRLFWWLIATERPRGAADHAALAAPFILLVLGALALSWPWVWEQAPRAVAETAAAVWTTIASSLPSR